MYPSIENFVPTCLDWNDSWLTKIDTVLVELDVLIASLQVHAVLAMHT